MPHDELDWFDRMLRDYIRNHYQDGAPKRLCSASSAVTRPRRSYLTLRAYLNKYHWRESNPLDDSL